MIYYIGETFPKRIYNTEIENMEAIQEYCKICVNIDLNHGSVSNWMTSGRSSKNPGGFFSHYEEAMYKRFRMCASQWIYLRQQASNFPENINYERTRFTDWASA